MKMDTAGFQTPHDLIAGTDHIAPTLRIQFFSDKRLHSGIFPDNIVCHHRLFLPVGIFDDRTPGKNQCRTAEENGFDRAGKHFTFLSKPELSAIPERSSPEGPF